MRSLLLRLLSGVMFWRPPARLVKVTVWSGNKVIGTITDDATLATFAAIWSRKIQQPKGTKATFQYSFDLQTLRGTKYSSTRWLYNRQGLTKVMVTPNIGTYVPIYRVPSGEKLNLLVGVDGDFEAEPSTRPNAT